MDEIDRLRVRIERLEASVALQNDTMAALVDLVERVVNQVPMELPSATEIPHCGGVS